jgi:hypothetical protein
MTRGRSKARLVWRGRGETYASRVAEHYPHRAYVWRFEGVWRGRCEVLGEPHVNDLGRYDLRVVSWGVSHPFATRRAAERWCARRVAARRSKVPPPSTPRKPS